MHLKVPYFEKYCPLNKKQPADGLHLLQMKGKLMVRLFVKNQVKFKNYKFQKVLIKRNVQLNITNLFPTGFFHLGDSDENCIPDQKRLKVLAMKVKL